MDLFQTKDSLHLYVCCSDIAILNWVWYSSVCKMNAITLTLQLNIKVFFFIYNFFVVLSPSYIKYKKNGNKLCRQIEFLLVFFVYQRVS